MVYVMIYDCPQVIDIPLKTRAEWIRKIYPQVHVLEVPSGPPDSKEDPEIMRQHEEFIREHLPEPITHLFSSEWYGDYISKALGAENICVDQNRNIIPISGTKVRSNPHEYRDYLHPIVYRDFIKKIVFLGAESTGKTTIAEEVAKEHKTEWMPEYGREYWEKNNTEGKLSKEQLVELANIHLEKEEELLQKANKYLFVDSNAITTEMFSRFYHGDAHPELSRLAKESESRYDLVFVCDTDIPYVEDGTRSGAKHREIFQRQIIEDLNKRGVSFILLSGTIKDRINKINETLKKFKLK
ncbi:TPA: cytidyltransferase [Patescibacteria group bacterium]|nr:cytidyltransferase [Patescibacteria group bacterium]